MGSKKAGCSKYPPLEGGWGWAVVAGATLSHFLVVGIGRSFGIFYLALLDFFGRTAAETAWVVALYNTMRMMLGPMVGVLCDKFTCQKVVVTGALLMCVGCIISAFATSLIYLYITFGLVVGAGGAMLFTPCYVIVGHYFDKKKGKAMGIATTGSGLGTVALAPLIVVLLKEYSFYGSMIILGGLMLNNLISGLLYRPLYRNYPRNYKPQTDSDAVQMKQLKNKSMDHRGNAEGERKGDKLGDTLSNIDKDTDIHVCCHGNKPEEKNDCGCYANKDGESQEGVNTNKSKTTAEGENVSTVPVDNVDGETKSLMLNRESAKQGEEDGKPQGQTVLKALLKYTQILRNSTFLLYGIHITAMSICIQTFLSFLPAIAEENGAEETAAAFLLSILGMSDMAGRFLFGVLFDLKTVRYRRRLFHALLGLPVGGLCFFTGFMASYAAFVVMTVLFGIVEGGFHSQRATIVSEFVPRNQMSYTVGFVIFFQGLGNILGPPVGGWLKDTLKNYNSGYFFSGSCLFITSILFIIDYFVKKSCLRKKDSEIPNNVMETA